jgi:hypothetical protein
MSPRTRWTGAGPAGPTRCPCRDYASGSCPSARSAAGRTRSSSTQCWPQQLSMAGPNRTCSMRSSGGRPTTSGSTPCSRRSPASAPPPAGRACRCARHARTWPRALATQRHNDHFGTQPKRSSDGGCPIIAAGRGPSAALSPASPVGLAGEETGAAGPAELICRRVSAAESMGLWRSDSMSAGTAPPWRGTVARWRPDGAAAA